MSAGPGAVDKVPKRNESHQGDGGGNAQKDDSPIVGGGWRGGLAADGRCLIIGQGVCRSGGVYRSDGCVLFVFG